MAGSSRRRRFDGAARILLCGALAVAAAPGGAGEQVTEGKYFSCLSAEWLAEFTSFAVSKDFDRVQSYLAEDKCLLLKPNLPVTVAGEPDDVGATTVFVIKGIRFYAPSEEIVLR